MYQITVDNKRIGRPMAISQARKWRQVLICHFRGGRVGWVKVG